MAVDGQPRGEPELVQPVQLADVHREQALDGGRIRPKVRAIDPHPDHLRARIDPVLALDGGQHVDPRSDVRRAWLDDVAQDRPDAVGASP